jgi:hypothetical protein
MLSIGTFILVQAANIPGMDIVNFYGNFSMMLGMVNSNVNIHSGNLTATCYGFANNNATICGEPDGSIGITARWNT